jgi:hypothetical protein
MQLQLRMQAMSTEQREACRFEVDIIEVGSSVSTYYRYDLLSTRSLGQIHDPGLPTSSSRSGPMLERSALYASRRPLRDDTGGVWPEPELLSVGVVTKLWRAAVAIGLGLSQVGAPSSLPKGEFFWGVPTGVGTAPPSSLGPTSGDSREWI